MPHPSGKLKRYARQVALSILAGILAGASSAVFLILLDWATSTRLLHPGIILALPLAGFAIGWFYHHHGEDISQGHNLILDEIHDPKKTVPLSMAPAILAGTVLTHLFGGSAGREGTAVQMGASLSDQLGRFFKTTADERRMLLVAGAGAGFGAAIGTPFAGAIFGMEVIYVGRLKLGAWLECLIASFVGFYVTVLLRAPHSRFPAVEIPPFDFKTLFWVAVAGACFGLASRLFVQLVHSLEKLQARFIRYSPFKPLLAGTLLAILFLGFGFERYAGLGIRAIQDALQNPASFNDPLLKSLFTALTIGSGFKGGEFIPLVFIGTTLGSALSLLIPISFQLLAATGFAAVFSGAANTPIACSLMAMEIFGLRIAPYAFIACFVSYACSGGTGIYRAQRKHR